MRTTHRVMRMAEKPTSSPMRGDRNSAVRIFNNPSTRIAENPAATTAAPSSPPSSAWDELDGIPRYHVTRFQITADIRAAITTVCVMASATSKELPMVVATATPNKKGPTKTAPAAIISATLGRSAREEITVATRLELSCNPLRKSNPRASAINI